MTMVLIPEVVSPEKMGFTSGMVGMTLGCSGILGPVLGGVISHFTIWRWIFLIKYVSTDGALTVEVGKDQI
jgi:MFS family permease